MELGKCVIVIQMAFSATAYLKAFQITISSVDNRANLAVFYVITGWHYVEIEMEDG